MRASKRRKADSKQTCGVDQLARVYPADHPAIANTDATAQAQRPFVSFHAGLACVSMPSDAPAVEWLGPRSTSRRRRTIRRRERSQAPSRSSNCAGTALMSHR
jgi:hypothetical protein